MSHSTVGNWMFHCFLSFINLTINSLSWKFLNRLVLKIHLLVSCSASETRGPHGSTQTRLNMIWVQSDGSKLYSIVRGRIWSRCIARGLSFISIWSKPERILAAALILWCIMIMVFGGKMASLNCDCLMIPGVSCWWSTLSFLVYLNWVWLSSGSFCIGLQRYIYTFLIGVEVFM